MIENDNNRINKSKAGFTPTKSILLGFIVLILIGSIILSLPFANSDGKWLNYIDALFTATSAVCVTGLVIADTAVQFSTFGQVIILILLQIGGLGFMTMATLVFMLLGKKITLKERLAIKESLVQFDLQGLVKLIKTITIMTLVIEAIGALLLMPSYIPLFGAGQGVFMAIFHSISAFCNAGFDLLGTSEAPFQGYSLFAGSFLACFPLLILIVTGGLGFAVIRDTFTAKKWSRLGIHTKVVLLTTAALITASSLFFFLAEYNNPLTMADMNFGEKMLNSLFQAITPRTAGFSTLSQADMTDASKLFTSVLMFIGAAPGSTAGGVKITVVFVLVVVMISNIKGRNQVVIDKQEIPLKKVMKAITIVGFGVSLIIVSSILIMLAEKGKDMMTLENLLFETISAFGTVGLSMGITPHLTYFSKVVLSITMLFGRVGPLTVGIAVASRYGSCSSNSIKYSESKIMVG